MFWNLSGFCPATLAAVSNAYCWPVPLVYVTFCPTRSFMLWIESFATISSSLTEESVT